MGPLSIYLRFFATYCDVLYLCLFGFVIFNNANSSCFQFFGLRFSQSYLSLFFGQPWLTDEIQAASAYRIYLIQPPRFYISRQNQTFFHFFDSLCRRRQKAIYLCSAQSLSRQYVCVCVRRYCLFFLYFMLFLFSRFFSLVSPFFVG